MSFLRTIPSIDALRQRPDVSALEAAHGSAAVLDALRAAADALRRTLRTGAPVDDPAGTIATAAAHRLSADARSSLVPVINATGVVIHTNLGRAPLAASAVTRVADVAAGYVALEYDVDAGTRGRRDVHVEPLLCRLTGAGAAVVVNNGAAAALLVLSAVARGREVLISRGELVEIGGGFRIPDVLTQSGARLREVGTTNRTRLADYAAAITDRTAAILRVHPSNFRMVGFTERPSLRELVGLADRFSLPVIEDLGSGFCGTPAHVPALADEPDVRRSLADGLAAAIFSGDKLLGGPQAGIVAGDRKILDTIRRHPLMRALRVDRLRLAALEATLVEYLAGRASTTVPVPAMIALDATAIGVRAEALASALRSPVLDATVEDGWSAVGGGSAPGGNLPTRLIVLSHATLGASALAAALRRQDPPVIARIERDRVVLDLRTVFPSEEDALVRAVKTAAGAR